MVVNLENLSLKQQVEGLYVELKCVLFVYNRGRMQDNGLEIKGAWSVLICIMGTSVLGCLDQTNGFIGRLLILLKLLRTQLRTVEGIGGWNILAVTVDMDVCGG